MSSSPLLPEVMLLPKTFSTQADLDDLANHYKNLRLQGLLSDPDAFSSTYERESQFTLETWRSRIQNPVAKTFVSFVAKHDNIKYQAIDTNTTGSQKSDEEDAKRCLQTKWAGAVTLLGPEIWSRQHAETKSPPCGLFTTAKDISQVIMSSDDYSGARIVYLLEGMFVVLPARRRGHGQQLIEAAVDHVREEAKKLNVSKASIVLRTSQAVTSARLFYEEMGFEAREEVVTASLPYTVMMLNFDLSMPE